MSALPNLAVRPAGLQNLEGAPSGLRNLAVESSGLENSVGEPVGLRNLVVRDLGVQPVLEQNLGGTEEHATQPDSTRPDSTWPSRTPVVSVEPTVRDSAIEPVPEEALRGAEQSFRGEQVPVVTRRRGVDELWTPMGIGVVSTLLALVFFYCAIRSISAVVTPNSVGIKRNIITNKVDISQVFPPGRYWFQPFTRFVLFPTTVQNVRMQLTTRTSEGYPLELKVEFQYQLSPDRILDLYSHYTINYEPVFQRNVRAEMMKAMSEYDAMALFTKRVDILRDIHVRVDRVLKESYAMCWGVQFDDVMQAKTLEETWLLGQLQKWFANQMLAEQRISAVEAKTQVLEAEFRKDISVVNSSATQKCKFIISQATAYASNYHNEAQSNATLLIDTAKAEGSAIESEIQAVAELAYQEALAHGDRAVLKERAKASRRITELERLQLQYWKSEVNLSESGLMQFQELLGSYERIDNIDFLFDFGNSYVSADASSCDSLKCQSGS